MPLSDLIDRARQGDAVAIARLITRSLAAQGVVAQGQWQGTDLQIALEGDEPIEQAATVPIIRRGLHRLQLTCPIEKVRVVSRQVGHHTPDWQEEFLLSGVGNEGKLGAVDSSPTGPKSDKSSAAAIGTPDETNTLLSDNALVALAQLGPLFGYLTLLTNGLIGFPFIWGGSTFLLPWRIIPPLIVLMVRGQESPFVRQQSKYALNFQLSMVIYWIVTIALMFILVGFLFVVPLALLELICITIAAVKSSEGKLFQYPLAIPFVK